MIVNCLAHILYLLATFCLYGLNMNPLPATSVLEIPSKQFNFYMSVRMASDIIAYKICIVTISITVANNEVVNAINDSRIAQKVKKVRAERSHRVIYNANASYKDASLW